RQSKKNLSIVLDLKQGMKRQKSLTTIFQTGTTREENIQSWGIFPQTILREIISVQTWTQSHKFILGVRGNQSWF
ncbi:hypothetical protein AS034_19735, partial [[Bacillus] enclensis]